ncbi:MAG: alpha-amylase family glycosyl hydrolase, partial [Prochlorotrichaceae cyanobacterium]
MLAQLNTRRRDREPRLTGLHDPDQLRPRWQIPNLKMLWVAILISALSLLGYGMVNRFSFPAESFVPIHENLGAIPSATGTHFRVWAPHAEKVAVMGSFNQWSAEADPMKAEGDGYWVAEIANAHPGDEYQYAIVNEESHETFYRIDPYARQVTHSMGNSIIYDPTFDWGDSLDYTPPPMDDLVLYELHIGTFVDEPGGRPGTFDSAIEQLPHIKELGANVIELLPVVEFSGDYSWGYNPSHPFAVESAYGGPHAFKRFVKAAHEQGLGIILDVVYNHFGPSDLSLWQFDGWSPDGKDTGIFTVG